MAQPVLLVADDLATIAAVKRALAKEGYEIILATSAADAVIAWGHHLPGLVLLQPTVETDRGEVVLEELRQHPDAQLLKVVLLGESVPGFGYHVEPLPIDPPHFVETVEREMRAAEPDSEWTVTEPRTEPASSSERPSAIEEPEPWRATRPAASHPDEALPQTQHLVSADADHPAGDDETLRSGVDGAGPWNGASADEAPSDEGSEPTGGHSPDSAEPQPQDESPTAELVASDDAAPTPPPPDGETATETEPADPPPPIGASPSVMVRLFGDLPSLEDELHRDVEAQAMATVESSLPPLGVDDAELRRLEEDVRAEAARRRAAREAKNAAALPIPELTPPPVEPLAPADPPHPAPQDTLSDQDEMSFAEVSAGATPPVASGSGLRAPAASAAAKDALSRAEAISLEGRAVAQAQRQTAEAERRRIDTELDALKRRVEHAESLIRREREARAGVEDQLEQLREEARTLADTLDRERTEAQQRFANDLAAVEQQAEARLAERDDRLGKLEQQLEQTERSLDVTNAAAVERAAERESLLASLSHEQEAARKAEVESASLRRSLTDLRTELDDERLAKMALEEQRDELTSRLEKAVTQVIEVKSEADTALKLASEVEATLDTTRQALASAQAQLIEVRQTVATLTPEAEQARALKAQVESITQTLEAERTRAAALVTDTVALKESIEGQRARADEAEALAQLSTERLKVLEHKQVMSLSLPGRRALGVPRNGSVSLEQLASLVTTIAAAQADVRLELGASGGTRTLWFKKGALHGAESSFDHESLIDRARRDGLIDARQEAELRLLRTATASEQLDAMKGRGLVREIETIPLLQRATETISLEAFSEEQTQYRLSDEPPGHEVLLVAVPRPTLPLLAEALRRAVPTDALLERLGGAEAVCTATDHELDLRALGFSDKERKMLSWVDGEASVEDLTLAAGLKQEVSFRALLVAQWLGIIEVHAPEHPTVAPSGDLDVRRLEAKFDEVQDADYFSILGLTRGASSEDVQRAYRRLAEEFDPIKFTGHPDASLQQRAQVVSTLLEEAARALEDERRRAEYARHLLD